MPDGADAAVPAAPTVVPAPAWSAPASGWPTPTPPASGPIPIPASGPIPIPAPAPMPQPPTVVPARQAAGSVRWEEPRGPVPAARRRGGAGLGVLIGLLVAGLVLGAGAVAWFVFLQPDDGSSTSTSADGVPAGELGGAGGAPRPVAEQAGEETVPVEDEDSGGSGSGSSTPPPGPTPEQLEAEAVATLDELAREGIASVSLDGRWVAQLSSKVVGTVDPLQVARNGSSQFFGTDILYEHDELQRTVGGSASVFLLFSTDFGTYSTDDSGRPYWITLADAGFVSSDDVDAWCVRTFPSYTAAELANSCLARRLEPSHP